MNSKDLTFIDLFAGAGGLSEGFLANNYHPVAHVEMNADACSTLRTRTAYYYLKNSGNIDIYREYLKGNIDRDELYNYVPESVMDTVINETMSADGMPSLISKIKSLMKKQQVSHIDVIVGGPPCQAYSLVGRAVKGEKIKNDPRNYLYELYLRVLKSFKPSVFVFENVPGILTANDGKFFNDIEESFSKAGYKIEHQILNARDFGVLQHRKRVILIGWKKELDLEYPLFDHSTDRYLVADLLNDLPPVKNGEEKNNYRVGKYSSYLKETGIRQPGDILTWHVARPNIDRDIAIYKKVIDMWNKHQTRLKYTDLPKELQTHKNMNAFLDRYKVVASNLDSSQTMMAHISKDGHYFIHPDIKQSRSITVREAARIQSFPDNFYFEGSRTAAFTQIGNAVPPLMAKEIALSVKRMLEGKNE